MTGRFWKQILTNVAGYVLCVLASFYLAEPAAAEIAKMIYRGMSLFGYVEPRGILAES